MGPVIQAMILSLLGGFFYEEYAPFGLLWIAMAGFSNVRPMHSLQFEVDSGQDRLGDHDSRGTRCVGATNGIKS